MDDFHGALRTSVLKTLVNDGSPLLASLASRVLSGEVDLRHALTEVDGQDVGAVLSERVEQGCELFRQMDEEELASGAHRVREAYEQRARQGARAAVPPDDEDFSDRTFLR